MARSKRKGVVYLLKTIDSNGLHVYKYGASTRSAKSRIHFANIKTKLTFSVLFEKKSNDIFNEENNFKWNLNRFNTLIHDVIWTHTCSCSEVFSFDCCMDEKMITMLKTGDYNG